MKFNVFVLFLLSTGALSATTPGWENFNLNRREVAPAKVVWQADFTTTAGFSLERRDGAEGRIAFSDGALTIEKTNDKGFLVAVGFVCVACMAQRDKNQHSSARVIVEAHRLGEAHCRRAFFRLP